MTKSTPKYRAPALDKGLAILELLASSSAPLSINAIAEGVGRSRGEIFRMLLVLEERGYIIRGEGESGYSLTNRLFRLGMEQPPVRSAVEAALPVMHRLAGAVEQPCHLVVPSREQIVVIARVDPPTEIGLVVRVGHRRPLAHATSGHVLFAFQSDEIRERWLSVLTEYEVEFDRKKFLKLANQIRAKGYASAPSQVVDGVTDVSAPVVLHDHATCALTIPYLQRRASRVTMERTIQLLCRAAVEISDSLQFGTSVASTAPIR
jgi:DNA-binding IclR family transcriptional regulator